MSFPLLAKNDLEVDCLPPSSALTIEKREGESPPRCGHITEKTVPRRLLDRNDTGCDGIASFPVAIIHPAQCPDCKVCMCTKQAADINTPTQLHFACTTPAKNQGGVLCFQSLAPREPLHHLAGQRPPLSRFHREAEHIKSLGVIKGMEKALIIPYGEKDLVESTTRTNTAAWLDFAQDPIVMKLEARLRF